MAMNNADQEDIVLWLDQAKEGDTRSFERLYRATCGAVYAVCLRMSADPGVAEECVQRTYIKAWGNLTGFQGNSRIETWLHRIAVNEVLGLGRQERQLTSATEAPDLMDLSDPSESLDLEKAIARLPERQRQVFVLFAVYGHGHAETGRLLNIAAGTSKAHFHHARQLLQKMLGEAKADENQ